MSGKSVARSQGVVEVVGDNGAHYRAFVVDVYDPSDPCILHNSMPLNGITDEPSVTLRFEDDWCPKQSFPLNRIRLPPATTDDKAEVKEGDDIEVLTEGRDGDGEGWWTSKVYMTKGADREWSIITNTSFT